MTDTTDEEESVRHVKVKLGPLAFSGFPVRVLTRPEQGGEWITAYQAEQKRHLQAVMLSSKFEERQSKVIGPPVNTREASCSRCAVLDEQFLLENCYVCTPSDLSEANISGKALTEFKPEDFLEFDSLVAIDGSDNHLPFDAFGTFPSLQSLELAVNGIMDIFLEEGHFQQLQYLNLSYNNLSGVSLLTLGMLPSLVELHLTGNNLVALPVEMSMPYALEGAQMARLRFPNLERLWLDENKLSDQATFATLAGFRRLRYLNLDNNEMYTIPRLKLLGTSSLNSRYTGGGEGAGGKMAPPISPQLAESSHSHTDGVNMDGVGGQVTEPQPQEVQKVMREDLSPITRSASLPASLAEGGKKKISITQSLNIASMKMTGVSDSQRRRTVSLSVCSSGAQQEAGGPPDIVTGRPVGVPAVGVPGGSEKGAEGPVQEQVSEGSGQGPHGSEKVSGDFERGSDSRSSQQGHGSSDQGSGISEHGSGGLRGSEQGPQGSERGSWTPRGSKKGSEHGSKDSRGSEVDPKGSKHGSGGPGVSEQDSGGPGGSEQSSGVSEQGSGSPRGSEKGPVGSEGSKNLEEGPRPLEEDSGAPEQCPVSGEDDGGGDGGMARNTMDFEQWSPTPLRMDVEASDLCPFPVLETLSLVNNLILSAEGLLACGSWCVLKEILIYDNPLTRTSKGMPPLLQEHLVNQRGIRVVRKKPEPSKFTTHIRKSAKDFKKVSSRRPPAIPKHLLPAIEAPPIPSGAPLEDSPSPSHTHSHQSFSSVGSGSTASQDSSDSNGIFITQVSGGDEPTMPPPHPTEEQGEECNQKKPSEQPWSVKEAFQARLKELKLKYKHVPQRYRGYEALLDVGDGPADNIPRDIHGCTRALQYALKHPLVKPDNQCPFNTTSYANQQQAKYLTRKSDGPLQTVAPKTSSKLSHLKKVLDDIRTQSHGVEANLAQVLTPKTATEERTAAQLQKESKKLLIEMQAHYDKVRAASLCTVSPSNQQITSADSLSKRQKCVRFSTEEVL